MSDPHSPWRDLNLSNEQDELVQQHIAFQMHTVRLIKKYVMHLAVTVGFVFLTQAYMRYLSNTAIASDLPGIDLMEAIFKWALVGVALLCVAMVAFAMDTLRVTQNRVSELPFTPYQVARVRQVTTWAVELALFGRTGFALLGRVRKLIKRH